MPYVVIYVAIVGTYLWAKIVGGEIDKTREAFENVKDKDTGLIDFSKLFNKA